MKTCGAKCSPKQQFTRLPNYPFTKLSSVIALIDDAPPVHTHFHEHRPVGFDHVIEPADVGVHVGASFRRHALEDGAHVVLDVASPSFPAFPATTERDHVMEVWMLGSNFLEIVPVVNVRFI